MRKAAAFLLVVAALLTLSGCASYWVDRGRDAKDIFTGHLGYGIGAKARVGVLQAGLLFDKGLIGLRGGEILGDADVIPIHASGPVKKDDVILVFGYEKFEGNRRANIRGKSFLSKQALLAWPMNMGKDPEWAAYARDQEIVYCPWPFFTQVEVVAGVLITFRVGANPGELVDFLLGWTTLDIYSDDIGLMDIPPTIAAPLREVTEPF